MKIVIATPVLGDTKAGYTHSLARMIIYTERLGIDREGETIRPELDYIQQRGPNVAHSRNLLTAAALESGADYILWIDADQGFPPHSLSRLASLDLAIVGCNYAKKSENATPTAVTVKGGKRELVWTDQRAAREGRVESVASIGFGLCLVATSAIRKLSLPWFAWGPNGEDGWFCDKMRDAGFLVFVDHGLSWDVQHIGERGFTNADTLPQRKKVR